MSGLRIYRSNQLERLAVALAAMLTDQLPEDPFAPVDILVGSRGMERWLRHRISEHRGICAQVRFQFPARFIEDRLQEIEGTTENENSPWSGQSLLWNLLEIWADEDQFSDPVYAPLHAYLEEDNPEIVSRRRYRLAAKIGEIFDRYAVFRPTWAQAWSQRVNSQDQPGLGPLEWQKFLWHRLTEFIDGDQEPQHMANRLISAVEAVRKSEKNHTHPLYVFGVSSLPPLWIEFLAELSHRRPVDLFLFSPSNQYWGELQRCAMDEWRSIDRDELPDALRSRRAHLIPGSNQGHPLLGSLGRVGRDTQIVIESLSSGYIDLDLDLFHDPVEQESNPESPSNPGTLQWLQSDILHMRTPDECLSSPDVQNRVLSPGDDSIQIHQCHGALRQVEVLRDTLLGLFESYPHLEPRDVVVMTPDIERYAPLISSVFDRGMSQRKRDPAGVPYEDSRMAWGSAGGPRIPYQIADLTVRRINPVADVLMRTLALANGRLESSSVAALLQLEPIQNRFNFQSDELPILHRWITESGIRWGRDAAHRGEHAQPASHQNTWRFGLDRLLLGVTTADEGQSGLDTLPYDDMEGQSVLLLGKFVDFVQTLFHCIDDLNKPKRPDEWMCSLENTVEQLTETTAKSAWLSRRVREVLTSIERNSERCHQVISLEAIQAELDGRFEIPDMTPKTQNGSVSFCALRPMRGIPYAVVCLLGMDEGTCPRPTSKAAFDLCALHPRIGDAHPRDDDRYMVLEALLSAREHFLMFYTGRSETTNEILAPAIPVGEIMDVLNLSFPGPDPATSFCQQITYSHPLQPFSPKNFLPSAIHPRLGPFSFDYTQVPRGSEAIEPSCQKPFFEGTNPQEVESIRMFELDRIHQFFRHPTRYMLSQELKLRFPQIEEGLKDREPMELDGLAQWKLKTHILSEMMAGGTAEKAFERCIGEGELPLGQPGRMAFEAAHGLARVVHAYRQNLPRPSEHPLRVSTRIGTHRLMGHIDALSDQQLVYVHASPLRDRHLLHAWIDLLVAHHVSGGEIREAFIVHCETAKGQVRATSTQLTHPPEAFNHLNTVLSMFIRGQVEPVMLLPKSSPAFVQGRVGRAPKQEFLFNVISTQDVIERPRTHPLSDTQQSCLKDGLKRAKSAYEKGDFCDAIDPYIHQVYGSESPFLSEQFLDGIDPSFAANALEIWAPIFSAIRKGHTR